MIFNTHTHINDDKEYFEVDKIISECKEENYREEKNVKNTTDRLEMNKYCPRCRKHTVHKEKK